MTEAPEPNERRHTEAPAEGEDTDAEEATSGARSHTEEPSEGAPEKAPDERTADEAADGGRGSRPAPPPRTTR